MVGDVDDGGNVTKVSLRSQCHSFVPTSYFMRVDSCFVGGRGDLDFCSIVKI